VVHQDQTMDLDDELFGHLNSNNIDEQKFQDLSKQVMRVYSNSKTDYKHLYCRLFGARS